VTFKVNAFVLVVENPDFIPIAMIVITGDIKMFLFSYHHMKAKVFKFSYPTKDLTEL